MGTKTPDEPREDIETRIRELRERAEELSGGEAISFVSDDCPAEVEGQFWRQVLACEDAAAWPEPFQMLVASGVALPAPEELDDARLTDKLWEVINGLALLGAYLYHTDHLSDRELYARLWHDVLRQPMMLLPDDPDFACHIDFVSSGSDEDNHLMLKYYADEDERRRWIEEWPDEPWPAREPPPFDRDRHLPQRTYGERFYTDS
jgi:hypothetical protein